MSTLRQVLDQIADLFRWWFVLAPWEKALRVRMGKRVDVLGCGVHVRIPVIDKVYRQNVRRRFDNVPTQTLTTLDGQVVTVRGVVGYNIGDIERLHRTLHHAQAAVESEAQGAIARWVRGKNKDECSPERLERDVTESIDLHRYGLSGVEVFITDFAACRTYRLIQGEPKDWMSGDLLQTDLEMSRGRE